MDKLIQEYMRNMNFEEFSSDTLTVDNLDALGNGYGVIVLTDTTDLWITRRLSTMSVLGVPTVFESASEFMVLDNFGFKLWDGDAASVIDYAKGFVNGVEEDLL